MVSTPSSIFFPLSFFLSTHWIQVCWLPVAPPRSPFWTVDLFPRLFQVLPADNPSFNFAQAEDNYLDKSTFPSWAIPTSNNWSKERCKVWHPPQLWVRLMDRPAPVLIVESAEEFDEPAGHPNCSFYPLLSPSSHFRRFWCLGIKCTLWPHSSQNWLPGNKSHDIWHFLKIHVII